MNEPKTAPVGEIDIVIFLGWLEVGCWGLLALVPILRFVNGPAVSRDQFVVHIGLVTLAATSAAVLLYLRLRCAKYRERDSGEDQSGISP